MYYCNAKTVTYYCNLNMYPGEFDDVTDHIGKWLVGTYIG